MVTEAVDACVDQDLEMAQKVMAHGMIQATASFVFANDWRPQALCKGAPRRTALGESQFLPVYQARTLSSQPAVA